MPKMRSLKLEDTWFENQWFDEALNCWHYDDFKERPNWRDRWISFDCAVYHPADHRVYLGLTSFASDIFKAYDRENHQFVDLGYRRIADRFDAKFHRSLVRTTDGCIYAAIALLHDLDKFTAAPGGAIVKYDPPSGSLTKLAIPVPHTYIQAIALDEGRSILYCLCFPPEKLASFNLKTGEVRDLGLIGTGLAGMTQSENLVLDGEGCLWSNWSLTRAWQDSPGPNRFRLCKYDPRKEEMLFFQKGLPYPDGRYGTAKAEAFFNFDDGFIYASGFNGSLYRIDPQTADAEFLFTPVPDRPSRLAALVRLEDSAAYGVTGREGKCELMRVDYRRGSFEKLGEIKDEDQQPMW